MPEQPGINAGEKHLTTGQVAEILQVKIYTVQDYIRKGELPAISIGPGKRPEYRIKQGDLEAFLEARKVVPKI